MKTILKYLTAILLVAFHFIETLAIRIINPEMPDIEDVEP